MKIKTSGILILATMAVMARGAVEYNGRLYENVGCYSYYSSPAQALADGEHYVGADGNIYWRRSPGYICWRLVGGGAEGGVAGGGQPAASSSISVSRIVRQNILTPATPRVERREQVDAPAEGEPEVQVADPALTGKRGGSADIFYNQWEVYGQEGTTIGLNPSITWGDRTDITLTVPIHLISPDRGDNIYAAGADLTLRHPIGNNLMLGVHGYGMGFYLDGDSDDDFSYVVGGGPFVAWVKQFAGGFSVSLGALLEFTAPEEGDTITEVVPAVNVGYAIGENLALNVYAIHYKNLDSDVDEDAYTDLGFDVRWVAGGWGLSAGVKTTTGLDNVDSTEFFLGTNWRF